MTELASGFLVALVAISGLLLLLTFATSAHKALREAVDRRHAQVDPKLLLDQRGCNLPGPKPEVQSVLPRILAVDPTKHLPLLRRRQLRGSSRSWPRGQRTLSIAAT